MLFDVIMVLLIIVGIVLVVFACMSKNKSENKNDYFEANAAVQLVKQAVDDADNAIEQLNKISSNVFEEFEEKYQELLFLYQMIDDMKEKRDKYDFNTSTRTNDSFEKRQVFLSERNYFKNPNLDKIKNMQEQGLSVSEISKALNMGQGEVKLILELGKARWFFVEKRSFILGLGIGIIFSVIISWVVYGISDERDLTKEEIEQKAREFGMEYSYEGVISEGESETAAEVVSYAPAVYEAETNEPESYNNDETLKTNSANDILQKANNVENKRTDNNVTEKETESNKITESAFKENSSLIENSEENTANSEENTQNEQADDLFIDVTISSGSNAKKVSNILAEKGIVDNALEYEKYLIDNKKAKRIRSGSYKIPKNLDYGNLTDIISR